MEVSRDEDEEELDYATLAKAGGRKDLLIHKDFVKPSEQPAPYPWVDWFDHEPPPSPPILPPIAGSHPGNLLTWQERSAKQQTTSLSLPSLRQRKLTYPFHQQRVNQRKRKTTKLPTIPNEPVSMMKLLGMEYQKDWVKGNEMRLADKRRRQLEKKEQQQQKLREHTMKARHISGVDKITDDKPRFIMKRFANIPSKLKLPPVTNQRIQDT